MADEQLISQQNNAPNGHIVAAVTNQSNHSDANVANSINLKNGSAKIICEFDMNHLNESSSSQQPPDGGTRAWCVMFSAFLCNSIMFGIINTYGTVNDTLLKNLQDSGVADANSKASMVGSLTIGTTFLLSPVSGVLTDKIGLKRTTFIGGCLMTSGMLLSSVLYYNIYFLYITYGLMFGLGAALAYTPTIAILGHYFKRYLGIVSGFVTCGSSIFTVALPKILEWLLQYGISTTCFAMGICSTVVILCALIYKPLQLPPPPPKRKMGQSTMSIAKMHLRSLVHVENFKKRRYIIWIIAMPIALTGYFVPYAHMVKYVKITYPGSDASLPIMCIGLTSGLGRLFFGFIADYKWVNRIFLQQMSFGLMGLFTIAIPLVDSYILLLIICLGIGIFDGCFISLLGPVAYDLCGPKGATQAIGFLLGLCSIPITSGAPIAGFLYDQSQSYYTSFVLSGIPWLVAAFLMSLIHYVRDERRDVCDKNVEDQVNKLLNKPAWTENVSEKNTNIYTFQKSNGTMNGEVKTGAPIVETTEFQIDDENTKL